MQKHCFRGRIWTKGRRRARQRGGRLSSVCRAYSQRHPGCWEVRLNVAAMIARRGAVDGLWRCESQAHGTGLVGRRSIRRSDGEQAAAGADGEAWGRSKTPMRSVSRSRAARCDRGGQPNWEAFSGGPRTARGQAQTAAKIERQGGGARRPQIDHGGAPWHRHLTGADGSDRRRVDDQTTTDSDG